MPKLTQQDWVTLREEYNIFSRLPDNLFELLLSQMYGSERKIKSNPGSNPGNPDGVDTIDALMIRLASAEPPIPPAP